ncbi:MAG: D-alanine--D-alanine ligase, partial [Candidatus Saccharimonadales bacterium]
MADLEDLVVDPPDLVFLGMKYIPSDPNAGRQDSSRIWLSNYFDRCGIAYTGSGQTAHELELNKSLAKQRMVEAGLNTSPFVVARENKQPSLHEIALSFPVFIKPIDRGGGAGVDSASLANNFEELQIKVEAIGADFQTDSLIEEYLPGREFSVAIIEEEFTGKYLTMPLELVAPIDKNGARFLSAKIKAADVETFK